MIDMKTLKTLIDECVASQDLKTLVDLVDRSFSNNPDVLTEYDWPVFGAWVTRKKIAIDRQRVH